MVDGSLQIVVGGSIRFSWDVCRLAGREGIGLEVESEVEDEMELDELDRIEPYAVGLLRS